MTTEVKPKIENSRVASASRRKPGLTRKRILLLVVGLAGFAWATLAGLIFMFNTGEYDLWFPGRILAYVLLLVAPALTFIPVGRALNFPFYGYWAVIGWAGFGYMLAFVPSQPQLGWRENATSLGLLLLFLFMVTVTVCLPIFYRLGFRLFSRRVAQYQLGRARREAILAGLYILLIAFLRVAGALNPLIAGSLLLAFVVLELLVLTRNIRVEG